MKKVTLRADAALIEKARSIARSRRTTLNSEFRDWLRKYIAAAGNGTAFEALMQRLKHIRSAGAYTRDEMNER